MSRRTPAVSGWVLFGLTALLSVPAVVIAATNKPPQVPVRSALEAQTSIELVSIATIIFLSFGFVGAVIVSERPGNDLGWVFSAVAPIGSFVILSYTYGYRAIASDPGSLPGGVAAAWMTDVISPIVLALMTVALFLLFPEGQLRTRAERITAWIAFGGVTFAMIGGLVEPRLLDYEGVSTPLDLATPAWVSMALFSIGFAMILGAVAASVVMLIARLRRATGKERDQLRLLVWASAAAAIFFAPSFVLPSVIEGLGSQWIFFVSGLAVLLVPVSVGIAILRHQLLDIELVIRRTLVVAILGVFITGVYVAVVVGVGALVGRRGSTVLSAVAAAVVALAFQPVKRWAHRLANRLVFGARATPYEVLHDFSERVAGSYATEDVLPRMATVLGEGTGAQRAQVWMWADGELRSAASWPSTARRSEPVSIRAGEEPEMPDVSLAVPVTDEGELLGALSITKEPSDPVSTTEERLVGDLALQARLVLRNVRLVEDLRASRGRLVKAQDEERRRLERNIHDGAQQQLVALAVKAKLADTMIDRDPTRAHEALSEVRAETQEALESLRDLARGIYPPLLADRGLAEALEAQARKAPMAVSTSAVGVGRYPQEIEATVYFCCLEALQNAGKYAEASHVRVTLESPDGALTFAVEDDGSGFDPGATPRGMGLQNMADRLEAVGGTLEIGSEPGVGTTIRGSLPITT